MGRVRMKRRSGPGRHAAKRRSSGGTLLALVLHTVKMQRRGAIIWGLALWLLRLLTVSFFPSLEDQCEQLNQLMESYPPELRELFGMSEGTDMTTIEGFLASQVF